MIINKYLIYLEITHSKINGSDDFKIKCHKNFFLSTTNDQSILKHVCNAAKQQKMIAFKKAFDIAKVDFREHCFFDLVPHDFLESFLETKNKITKYVGAPKLIVSKHT